MPLDESLLTFLCEEFQLILLFMEEILVFKMDKIRIFSLCVMSMANSRGTDPRLHLISISPFQDFLQLPGKFYTAKFIKWWLLFFQFSSEKFSAILIYPLSFFFFFNLPSSHVLWQLCSVWTHYFISDFYTGLSRQICSGRYWFATGISGHALGFGVITVRKYSLFPYKYEKPYWLGWIIRSWSCRWKGILLSGQFLQSIVRGSAAMERGLRKHLRTK